MNASAEGHLLPIYADGAFKDTRGRLKEDPRSWSGSIGVFILSGQSGGSNVLDAAHRAVNVGKVHNLSLIDGQVYALADPMLGTDVGAGGRGNLFTRVADGLVSAGVCDHAVMVPTNVGGTSAAQWEAFLWRTIVVAAEQCKAAGLIPTAHLHQQGETDTALSTSKIAYRGNVLNMLLAVRGHGVDLPWLLAKSSLYHGDLSASVREAIDEIVASDPKVFAGPDLDVISARQPDRVHLSGTSDSAGLAAATWVAAIAHAGLRIG